MPPRYFRFREPAHVATHIRAVRQFRERETSSTRPFECDIRWIDHPDKGYTEFAVVTRDRRMLLERICCALAAEEINILSADFFTRGDGIVIDLFRVCTTDFAPVDSPATRKRVVDTLYQLHESDSYDAARYLRRRQNYLKQRSDGGIAFPVRAHVSNTAHQTCTVVEIQALDRIGLLHDVFHTINALGLSTAHARICTEKGAAMDTLYLTTGDGHKVTDPTLCETLRDQLARLAATPEDDCPR
jgi:[protein-PII] uridylyltransferase